MVPNSVNSLAIILAPLTYITPGFFSRLILLFCSIYQIHIIRSCFKIMKQITLLKRAEG